MLQSREAGRGHGRPRGRLEGSSVWHQGVKSRGGFWWRHLPGQVHPVWARVCRPQSPRSVYVPRVCGRTRLPSCSSGTGELRRNWVHGAFGGAAAASLTRRPQCLNTGSHDLRLQETLPILGLAPQGPLLPAERGGRLVGISSPSAAKRPEWGGGSPPLRPGVPGRPPVRSCLHPALWPAHTNGNVGRRFQKTSPSSSQCCLKQKTCTLL